MGGFLLDTNFLSELRKRHQNAGVHNFLKNNSAANFFVSSISIGEIQKGIAKKRIGNPADAKILSDWLFELENRFSDRILIFGAPEAKIWGELCANTKINPIDLQIAAIAKQNGLKIVTRNVKDFNGLEIDIINPWDEK